MLSPGVIRAPLPLAPCPLPLAPCPLPLAPCPLPLAPCPLPLEADPAWAGYDKDVCAWVAPIPMSLIDTRVVRRSASLIGLDIAYQEFLIFTGALAPMYAAGAAAGVSLFYKALRSPSVRDLLMKHFFKAGEGPSTKSMDNGWFRYRVRGRTADGRIAEARLAGPGDPGTGLPCSVCAKAPSPWPAIRTRCPCAAAC